jgi:hypothetical protein
MQGRGTNTRGTAQDASQLLRLSNLRKTSPSGRKNRFPDPLAIAFRGLLTRWWRIYTAPRERGFWKIIDTTTIITMITTIHDQMPGTSS